MNQPANSPDCNIADLGFFVALQAKQNSMPFANNKEERVQTVRQAWSEYPPEKIDDVFCTYFAVLDEIIKDRGDNGYDMPHLKKTAIRREFGCLPLVIGVSAEAEDVLNEMGLMETVSNLTT